MINVVNAKKVDDAQKYKIYLAPQKGLTIRRQLAEKENEESIERFNNGTFIDILPDNSWKGRRCFVIGGGESLKGFDWDLLQGELTIGINRVYEFMSPTILFSMDTRFMANILQPTFYGARAKRLFDEYDGFKVWNLQKPKNWDGVHILKCLGRNEWSSSLTYGLGGGRNSGFGAVNLAYCLGADPIYLLGFDMKGDGKGNQAHFHSGHPDKQKPKAYREFIECFRWAANNVPDLRGRVINLTPNSAMDVFKKDVFSSVKRITRPIVVSYYTKDELYESMYRRMHQSLHKFGLEHDIEAIDSMGDWQANTYHKAKFIRRKLNEHAGRDILWMDVDAEVCQYPERFDNFDGDFAVHYIEWGRYGREPRRELNSSVMYFRNSWQCRVLLEKWLTLNERNKDSGVWEQKNLAEILEKSVDLRKREFPAQYCQIYDLMAAAGEPVIRLFQASRQYKARQKAAAG